MNNTSIQEEEDEWTLVPPLNPNPSRRFVKAVRKIIKLLRLRKIWGKAGRWLQLPISHRPRYVRARRIISHIFASWPTAVLRGSKIMFAHLERVNGRLVYRAQ